MNVCYVCMTVLGSVVNLFMKVQINFQGNNAYLTKVTEFCESIS